MSTFLKLINHNSENKEKPINPKLYVNNTKPESNKFIKKEGNK